MFDSLLGCGIFALGDCMARPYPKFTFQDYLLLPEDKRYELIGGDLLMVPSSSRRHQDALLVLARHLAEYVEAKKLGFVFIAPYDVVLSEFDVVQPDLIFVAKERASIITEANIQGAPDLVVEITSANAEQDRIIKRKLYARYGILTYWLVDPEAKTVEVLELDKEGYSTKASFEETDTLTSSRLLGFKLPLNKLFK